MLSNNSKFGFIFPSNLLDKYRFNMKTVAVCFVCGSKGASNALSIKPRDKGAYFSFLENHELPNGAKKPTEDGIVNACLVCYAFLNEQWNSYERNKVPLVKRLYWLKRVDNRAFTGAEMSLQGEYVAQVMGLQYNSNVPGNLCPFDYGSHIGISCGDIKTVAPSPTNDSNISPNSENSEVDGVEVLDLSISPKKTRSRTKKAQKPEPANGLFVDAANSQKSATPLDIVCYTCGNSFQNSRARFIYATKFSDEEPFFPFIYALPEPKGAMAISKNGLTQVCCNCRKALCRQWKIFEARSIPISERSYRINDMPVSEHKKISSVPRNKEYGFSEFEIDICYLCGEVSSIGSMHSVSTRSENGKTRDSMVLPFIESLKPAPGVHPVGNKGKVNTCSACYNFLFLQWKQFDTDRVPPEKQSFVLRSVSVKKQASYPFNNGDIKTTDVTEQVSLIKCMQFSKNNFKSSNPLCPSSNLLLHLKVENEKDTGSIPKNHLQSKTDFNENMTTLQSLLQIPTELSPSSNIPISGKQLPVGNECNKTQHCFLCDSVECWVKKNGKVSSEMFILCSRPMDNNQNLSDAKRAGYQPFFPFISELATSSKTKSMSTDGTVVVCGVCYYNLMAQWISFENVDQVLEQECWKRKYKHDSFACLVCKQVVHRHETKVMPFENVHRFHGEKVPLDSISNELKYVPVCNFCCNEMKSDNGSQKREKKQLRSNSQMSKICKVNIKFVYLWF